MLATSAVWFACYDWLGLWRNIIMAICVSALVSLYLEHRWPPDDQ